MSRRARLDAVGLLAAVLGLVIQAIIWTVVLLASMFLSLVLVVLVGSTLDPTNWRQH
jgi:hypothetical protein